MRTIMFIVTIGVFLVSGCSHEIVDIGFSLIEDSTIESIEPSHYTPGSQVDLTVSCECRYAGRGRITVVGHGGGSDVGTLLAPVNADLGVLGYESVIPAGRLNIPLTIEMTTTLERPAIAITVAYDSLLVDGAMVHWHSPEGHEVYREDIPEDCAFISNSTYQYVVIPRAEQ